MPTRRRFLFYAAEPDPAFRRALSGRVRYGSMRTRMLREAAERDQQQAAAELARPDHQRNRDDQQQPDHQQQTQPGQQPQEQQSGSAQHPAPSGGQQRAEPNEHVAQSGRNGAGQGTPKNDGAAAADAGETSGTAPPKSPAELTEAELLQKLEDLKAEKRKIFSLIAMNMKRKTERESAKAKEAFAGSGTAPDADPAAAAPAATAGGTAAGGAAAGGGGAGASETPAHGASTDPLGTLGMTSSAPPAIFDQIMGAAVAYAGGSLPLSQPPAGPSHAFGAHHPHPLQHHGHPRPPAGLGLRSDSGHDLLEMRKPRPGVGLMPVPGQPSGLDISPPKYDAGPGVHRRADSWQPAAMTRFSQPPLPPRDRMMPPYHAPRFELDEPLPPTSRMAMPSARVRGGFRYSAYSRPGRPPADWPPGRPQMPPYDSRFGKGPYRGGGGPRKDN
ncbi:hypothetical protein HK105_207023 [Polyrhizophydium stewartii]|uniref:Uncharacterized protein n=1 Tax=Polyrhizophydium stewartii TaxID=2732419 RepID=A0ABR4N1T1_9FUNG|nr:hypothetical protein HK105_006285 [Polyrhizophydium stewartii]